MEAPHDSARRGSGISLSINRGPQQHSRTRSMERQHMDHFQYPGYPPYYMQSPPYPYLMNPPPMPTYNYGIPPSPYLMGGPAGMMYDKHYFPSTPNIRRSNSKMLHQRPPSIVESDFMDGKPNGFTYNAAPEPNDIGFDKGTIEDQAILGELKRSNSERASAFTSFIESNKQAKGYSVRKGEYNQNASRQPYPGVIIEEMLDSVSVHSGVEHENYPVALIGDHQEEMKPKEPDNTKHLLSAPLYIN